jgi:uncharacterized protein YjbI with pentapeptide repeats
MRRIMTGMLLVWLGAAFASTAFTGETERYKGKNVDRKDFAGESFEKYNFEDASCFLTNFRGCKLAGEAKLKNTKNYSDVNMADFRGADLRGAKMLDVKNIDTAKFKGAKHDKKTRFPPSFDPADAGMVLVETDKD